MSTIHIVSHCWAEKNKQFAAALAYQLSSLEIYSPKHETWITVVCTESDKAVREVIEQFQNTVNVQPYFLPLEQLGRRSIGRNRIAMQLSGSADIFWFADCDYFFGEGCLDSLGDHIWSNDCVGVFPRMVQISKTHTIGDNTLGLISDKALNINPNDFENKQYYRAIGGAQIVRGSVARQCGYLGNDSKWQSPTNTPFKDTKEDVFFRRQLKVYGKIVGIDLPNCFRLRHSQGHPA